MNMHNKPHTQSLKHFLCKSKRQRSPMVDTARVCRSAMDVPEGYFVNRRRLWARIAELQTLPASPVTPVSTQEVSLYSSV
jgi:hypothetical protein